MCCSSSVTYLLYVVVRPLHIYYVLRFVCYISIICCSSFVTYLLHVVVCLLHIYYKVSEVRLLHIYNVL